MGRIIFFQIDQALKAQGENQSCISLIDYNNLTDFALGFKQELGIEFGTPDKANKFISYLQELKDIRNKCNHYQVLDNEEIDGAYLYIKQAAKLMKTDELVSEIDKIKDQEQPMAPIPAWFTNVYPHYDIRNGVLDESVFAANLGEVALGIGQEVYNNPTMFFEKTYITAGLRDIANRVVRALNGEESENRVISLQTGFGGGKTHTLISLYHITKAGRSLLNSAYTAHLLNENIRGAISGRLIPQSIQAKF